MLTNSANKEKLFLEVESLVSSLNLKTVEVTSSDHQGTTSMRIILYKEDREINTDDLAMAYNLIYPRFSILMQDRNLEIEVSSPGLQRNLKDFSEFSVFKGKSVRVYSTDYSCYVIGRIEDFDNTTLILSDYLIEDKNETGERIALPASGIAKAKLEYRWETEKNA